MEFGGPEFWARCRDLRKSTSFMHMPKASVNKNDDPASRQDDVWRARQVSAMQPESVASRKQQAPYQYLELRIFGFNARHHSAARSG
jgi:hypothetical protein